MGDLKRSWAAFHALGLARRLHSMTGPGGLRMLLYATADRFRLEETAADERAVVSRLAAHLPARGVSLRCFFLRCPRTALVTDWPCGQSASVTWAGEIAAGK
jgi:hypothetical protein